MREAPHQRDCIQVADGANARFWRLQSLSLPRAAICVAAEFVELL